MRVEYPRQSCHAFNVIKYNPVDGLIFEFTAEGKRRHSHQLYRNALHADATWNDYLRNYIFEVFPCTILNCPNRGIQTDGTNPTPDGEILAR